MGQWLWGRSQFKESRWIVCIQRSLLFLDKWILSFHWWYIFKRYFLILKCFNRADEGEDCKRKEFLSPNTWRWQLSVKNSIQLYEKKILSEKFISFGEVRSIISLLIKFSELIDFDETMGVIFYWEAVLSTKLEMVYM